MSGTMRHAGVPGELVGELRELREARRRDPSRGVEYKALILSALNAGWGCAELAEALGVTTSAVSVVKREAVVDPSLLRELPPRPPRPTRDVVPKKPTRTQVLRERVTDAELAELRALWLVGRRAHGPMQPDSRIRAASEEFNRRVREIVEDRGVACMTLSLALGASRDMVRVRLARGSWQDGR
jgi:hypothetical protein